MALTPQFGSIVPSQVQEVLQTNYLQWTDPAAADFSSFAQQYLPEIYEAEVERYGNRTLSGFLRMVGAELPMTSDQVIWSEQNRLHIAYDNCTVPAANQINLNPTAAADINNVISPRATIVVMDDFGAEVKCLVTASDTATDIITVEPYTAATVAGVVVGNVKVFVYGSEYQKGSVTPNNTAGPGPVNGYISVDPAFTQFSNNPVIIRNKYTVNGSDMAQIGWVEVATEDGNWRILMVFKS